MSHRIGYVQRSFLSQIRIASLDQTAETPSKTFFQSSILLYLMCKQTLPRDLQRKGHVFLGTFFIHSCDDDSRSHAFSFLAPFYRTLSAVWGEGKVEITAKLTLGDRTSKHTPIWLRKCSIESFSVPVSDISYYELQGSVTCASISLSNTLRTRGGSRHLTLYRVAPSLFHYRSSGTVAVVVAEH